MEVVEEVIRQFISQKRLQVSEGVTKINEDLRNHISEAANYLIRVHDITDYDNLKGVLNEEINRVHNFSDYDDINAMALKAITNLEELATIATEDCVIKYWNDYIEDVMKELNEIDVHECFEKQDVMKCAMAIQEKVHFTFC